jgi:hypothetical protein
MNEQNQNQKQQIQTNEQVENLEEAQQKRRLSVIIISLISKIWEILNTDVSVLANQVLSKEKINEVDFDLVEIGDLQSEISNFLELEILPLVNNNSSLNTQFKQIMNSLPTKIGIYNFVGEELVILSELNESYLSNLTSKTKENEIKTKVEGFCYQVSFQFPQLLNVQMEAKKAERLFKKYITILKKIVSMILSKKKYSSSDFVKPTKNAVGELVNLIHGGVDTDNSFEKLLDKIGLSREEIRELFALETKLPKAIVDEIEFISNYLISILESGNIEEFEKNKLTKIEKNISRIENAYSEINPKLKTDLDAEYVADFGKPKTKREFVEELEKRLDEQKNNLEPNSRLEEKIKYLRIRIKILAEGGKTKYLNQHNLVQHLIKARQEGDFQNLNQGQINFLKAFLGSFKNIRLDYRNQIKKKFDTIYQNKGNEDLIKKLLDFLVINSDLDRVAKTNILNKKSLHSKYIQFAKSQIKLPENVEDLKNQEVGIIIESILNEKLEDFVEPALLEEEIQTILKQLKTPETPNNTKSYFNLLKVKIENLRNKFIKSEEEKKYLRKVYKLIKEFNQKSSQGHNPNINQLIKSIADLQVF